VCPTVPGKKKTQLNSFFEQLFQCFRLNIAKKVCGKCQKLRLWYGLGLLGLALGVQVVYGTHLCMCITAYSGRAYMYTPALVGVTTLQRFGLELGLTTATSMVFVVLVLNSRL